MIIKEPQDWKYYLQKISKQNNHAFSMSKRGTLIVNGKIESYNFLAYQNGCWYGAKGYVRGASEKVAEKGKALFIISEKDFWMLRSDGNVEYYSSTKPLSEDAVAFLFAEHSPGICLYAVDGSRQESPMVTSIDPAPYSSDMAAMIVIALVRQHDPESAEQMEAFWYQNSETDNNEDENENLPW